MPRRSDDLIRDFFESGLGLREWLVLSDKHLKAWLRQTEGTFQRWVIDLAAEHGWRWFHAWDMTLNEPGFPDLVLLHPERHLVAFWELKSKVGKSTVDQEVWIQELQKVHGQIDSRFLRPSDWEFINMYLTGRDGASA